MSDFRSKTLNKTFDFSSFFNNAECKNLKVVLGRYANSINSALYLIDEKNNIITVLSTNLDIPLAINFVFIKNWGENQGILEELVSKKIVRKTSINQPTGFVEATLVEILDFENYNVNI